MSIVNILNLAIKNNDLPTIIRFINDETVNDINLFNIKNYEIMKIILLFATDIQLTKQDNIGNTILHYANTDITELLLEKMPQEAIDVKNNKGDTALFYTFIDDINLIVYNIYNNEIKNKTKLLLEKMSQSAIDVQNNKGRTALHGANYEKTNLLLEKMSQSAIDIQDNEGNTALHYAGMLETISLLLKMSYEVVNLKNNDGDTALYLAKYEEDDYIQRCMFNYESKYGYVFNYGYYHENDYEYNHICFINSHRKSNIIKFYLKINNFNHNIKLIKNS